MDPLITLYKFFGLRPGQSLVDFRNEVGQLSVTGRRELAALADNELAHDRETKKTEPEPAAIGV